MTLAALLPNTPGLLVEQVILGGDHHVGGLPSDCGSLLPLLRSAEFARHSYACRTLVDLPVTDGQVHLSLQVHCFRCGAIPAPAAPSVKGFLPCQPHPPIGPSVSGRHHGAHIPSTPVPVLPSATPNAALAPGPTPSK